ncbi:hypothetical protein C8J57DRAFT_1242919 [Mycena rebaudengoi]|nr:hypothetical protein C8J57DRAFT_1242919 [Mycena rebaudengoi]
MEMWSSATAREGRGIDGAGCGIGNWTKDVGIRHGPSHLSINEIVSKIGSMWGESRREIMSKGYQMLYINQEAAVKKTRILKYIAAAQRADPADLGRYGSAKDD